MQYSLIFVGALATSFYVASELQWNREEVNSMLQRSREVVAGPITLDYLVQKAAEGWKVAAVEWVKEVDAVDAEPLLAATGEEIPYGLQISDDGLQLEQNPLEKTVLLLILEKIVREKRITLIASELNASGLRTRQGVAWSASVVFELLPRVIEVGPALLKSGEWRALRSRPAAAHN